MVANQKKVYDIWAGFEARGVKRKQFLSSSYGTVHDAGSSSHAVTLEFEATHMLMAL